MKEKKLKALDVSITVVAVAMAIYHLISTQYLLHSSYEHQITHLGFALVIVFLLGLRATSKRWSLILTSVLLLFSLVTTTYMKVFFWELQWRSGFPTIPDMIIGVLLLITVIEAIRRSYGLALPILIIIGLIYTFIGYFLPPPFYHTAGTPARVLSTLTTGFAGIYGSLLGSSADIIFLFILFGGVLQSSRAIDFFRQIANLAARKMKGGAGETAVISSALVGTVQGSGLANVMMTGCFTIPLMKGVGYTPEQAGAIEAAASAGGQILPPVMGVAAFLMAAITGIPYAKIAAAAVIPALLYFLSCGIYVELQARKMDFKPVAVDVEWGVILRRGPLFIVPLLILIIQLVQGHSPMYAAFWAIVSLLALNLVINWLTRAETILQQLKGMTEGLRMGAIQGAQIAAACAGLGLTMAALTRTGLGLAIGHAIVAWSGGSLLVGLMLTMVVSIIFGMFSVTMVAYGLTAIIAVPALTTLGAGLLQAHLFALYFAVLSAVTPPIAMNALGACSLSGGNYFKTSVIAFMICLAAFLMPYLFIWNSSLLLQPPDLLSGALTLLAVVLGLLVLNVIVCGYYLAPVNMMERVLFGLSAIGLWGYGFTLNYAFLVAGVLLFIPLYLGQKIRSQRFKLMSEAISVSRKEKAT